MWRRILTVLMLMFIVLPTYLAGQANALSTSGVMELLEINQIYDRIVVVANVNATMGLYELPEGSLKDLKYMAFGIANFTPDANLVKWFFDKYNPELKVSTDMVFWRGAVLNITYPAELDCDEAKARADALAEKLNSIHHIGLYLLKRENNSFIYVSQANYSKLISTLMTNVRDAVGDGFILVPQRLGVKYLAYYLYPSEGIEGVSALGVATLNLTRDDLYRYVKIDYLSVIGGISSSSRSSSSRIVVRLYGLMVNSTQIEGVEMGDWVSGLSSEWITHSWGEVAPGTRISNFSLTLGTFHSLLIVTLSSSTAHPELDEKFNLKLRIKNLGDTEARNVTVKLRLPEGFEPVSQTTVKIESIPGGGAVERSFEVKSVLNGTFIIPAPTCTYTVGATKVEVWGNEIALAPGASSFASVSARMIPLANLTEVTGGSSVDYNLTITNIGDVKPSSIKVVFSGYSFEVVSIAPGESFTETVSYDPTLQRFMKHVPNGALSNGPTVIEFTNGSGKALRINVWGLSQLPSLSISINNHAMLFGQYVGDLFFTSDKLVLRWNLTGLGGSRPVSIVVYKKPLDEMGLQHGHGDDFMTTYTLLKAEKSVAAFSNGSLGLVLETTAKDHYHIPPPIVKHPSSIPDCMLEPVTVSNGIEVSKSALPDVLTIGETVEVKVTVRNLGTTPLYDVHVNDTVPEGWILVEGATEGWIEILTSNSTFEVSYKIRAENPINETLPSAQVTVSLSGISLRFSTRSLALRIGLTVNIIVLTSYNESLPSGRLRIIDEKIGRVYNLTISDGRAIWNGYIGVFKVEAYYESNLVLSERVTITRETSDLKLQAAIYRARLSIYDLLGLPLKGIKVVLRGEGGYTRELMTGSNGTVSMNLLPGAIYTIEVRFGGQLYTYRLVVDKNIESYKLFLPVIGGLSAPALMGGLAAVLAVLGLVGIYKLSVRPPIRRRRFKRRR